MKKYNEITAVCFVASTYSMLLYLLVYGKKQFETTYFFVSDAISAEVQSKLKYKQYLSFLKMVRMPRIVRNIYRFLLYRTCYWRWPFLKTVPIYGHDHLWFSSALLHKRTMVVIEDGLGNYDEKWLIKPMLAKHKKLMQFIYGPNIVKGDYGLTDQAEQVVMTQLAPIPECLKHKAKIVDIQNLWKMCDAKDYIGYLFGITNEDLLMLAKKKVIILTQPYNAEIGDDSLIEIYRKIIDKYNPDEVVMKTHPRDNLDYEKAFPGVKVYTKKVPAELFALLGIHFDDVYTINSTSIFSFPKKSNLHYLGNKCHPKLIELNGQDTIEGPAQN